MAAISVDEAVDIAIAGDRMARRVGHRFVLDERKLEMVGFTMAEIDEIYDRIEGSPCRTCRSGALTPAPPAANPSEAT